MLLGNLTYASPFVIYGWQFYNKSFFFECHVNMLHRRAAPFDLQSVYMQTKKRVAYFNTKDRIGGGCSLRL